MIKNVLGILFILKHCNVNLNKFKQFCSAIMYQQIEVAPQFF